MISEFCSGKSNWEKKFANVVCKDSGPCVFENKEEVILHCCGEEKRGIIGTVDSGRCNVGGVIIASNSSFYNPEKREKMYCRRRPYIVLKGVASKQVSLKRSPGYYINFGVIN